MSKLLISLSHAAALHKDDQPIEALYRFSREIDWGAAVRKPRIVGHVGLNGAGQSEGADPAALLDSLDFPAWLFQALKREWEAAIQALFPSPAGAGLELRFVIAAPSGHAAITAAAALARIEARLMRRYAGAAADLYPIPSNENSGFCGSA